VQAYEGIEATAGEMARGGEGGQPTITLAKAPGPARARASLRINAQIRAHLHRRRCADPRHALHLDAPWQQRDRVALARHQRERRLGPQQLRLAAGLGLGRWVGRAGGWLLSCGLRYRMLCNRCI